MHDQRPCLLGRLDHLSDQQQITPHRQAWRRAGSDPEDADGWHAARPDRQADRTGWTVRRPGRRSPSRAARQAAVRRAGRDRYPVAPVREQPTRTPRAQRSPNREQVSSSRSMSTSRQFLAMGLRSARRARPNRSATGPSGQLTHGAPRTSDAATAMGMGCQVAGVGGSGSGRPGRLPSRTWAAASSRSLPAAPKPLTRSVRKCVCSRSS